ncbi:class I SAM-dependent methyltransferase [Microbacterium sp. CJ88]|uniref:class I SAM-dependent methyltransferase n=1 Tax=Microbacterium sp. CJ88 TaxID=3445672 RepID=UPI003F65E138
MDFPFDALRRRPDLEAPDLQAWDAADTLILDESAAARAAAGAGEVVVIGDGYGALALAAIADGAAAVRVHQDPLTGERALAANAAQLGGVEGFASMPLEPALVSGAGVVLLRLPRSLDALRDLAGLIAAHAAPDVVVFAGGRVKHMTLAMNDVLRAHFATLDVTHARQKSRVLVARGPHDGADPRPSVAQHPGLPTVCAYGGAFAGTSIDIGTRFLLEHLPRELPAEVIDLACGTGVVGVWMAMTDASIRVVATDQSAAAVASALATADANGVADRVEVVRDDALGSRADGSAEFIALNPPFHVGAAVHDGVALRLFAEAGRVLATGGRLWTVWNSPLRYRAALERAVGPTTQVARNAKFTVTVSTAR